MGSFFILYISLWGLAVSFDTWDWNKFGVLLFYDSEKIGNGICYFVITGEFLLCWNRQCFCKFNLTDNIYIDFFLQLYFNVVSENVGTLIFDHF